ncbi:7460_t:CDS:1, partial [Racocetra persica]
MHKNGLRSFIINPVETSKDTSRYKSPNALPMNSITGIHTDAEV